MKIFQQINLMQKAVLGTSILLFATWLVTNFRFLTFEQNGFIRFFLTLLFSLAILLRPKQEDTKSSNLSSGLCLFLGLAGTLSTIAGLIFDIHQIEWLGLLIILFSCLSWSLPSTYRRDVFPALFLIYWAHPLPGTIFGRMQLEMQKMSVLGSEWFLQVLNVRVWADGFVLYAGLTTFEIPEWCSGMRTATTVFILALGLGILRRFKWQECLILIILSLAQAIILNILRIATMVALIPALVPWSSAEFLHNTSGIIVLTAVFITYLEIAYWKEIKQQKTPLIHETDLRKGHQLIELPPFWSWALHHKVFILITLLAISLVPVAIYKSRPEHKAEMIKDVASALRDSGALETAQKAAEVAQKLTPYDNDWNMTIIRLLIIRQKYELAFDELKKMSAINPVYDLEKDILKAYCLMSLKRIKEAGILVQQMPEDVRQKDPRVAMILAEMAFYAGKADDTAKYIATASAWYPNMTRIRPLYPFLRNFRKWRAIADSDINVPYTDSSMCLSAIEAHMNLNNAPRVATMIQEALTAWPDDPRILEPLFFMALKRGEGKWEERFSTHLAHCIKSMRDPDNIAEYFDKCFQLTRPDLAWLLYDRIAALDPAHPSLYMCAAIHGNTWFTFRKRFLNLSAQFEEETIDVKHIFLLSASFPSWQLLFNRVPLAHQLAEDDNIKVRKAFLTFALKEFEKRYLTKRASLAMQYEYVRALEMDGSAQKAIDIINDISAAHPETEKNNKSSVSAIYERTGDWQNVYEILRTLLNDENPDLLSLFRLCRAQVELKLNLAALHTAQMIMQKFPDSTFGINAMAGTLMTLHSSEEALFVLSKPRLRRDPELDIAEAEALFRTQRYKEAVEYCRTMFLPGMVIPANARQESSLPPAEAALEWHTLATPLDKDFAIHSEMLRKAFPLAKSPFIRKLSALWIECYNKRCTGKTADISEWLACGRDNIEKAVALHQLTLLLCRDKQFINARNVAGKAVKYMPESTILWKTLIGLSGADIEVINAARRSCPLDPEIWLAELVAKTDDQQPKIQSSSTNKNIQEQLPWSEETVIRHFSKPSGKSRSKTVPTVFADYQPAAVARAGEYLLRKNYRQAACMATRDAIRRARDLLPIYILGLRCALAEKDKTWAAECTTLAINASLRPSSALYKEIIQSKSSDNSIITDNNMLEALKLFRQEEPHNPLWAQMLGYVRFMRGGWESAEALPQMMAAIDAGATNKTPFIIAAESARLLRNYATATEILKKGLKYHPGDIEILNNLVYVLATSPATSPGNAISPQQEALKMVPELLKNAGNNIPVLDTIAVTYLKAGEFDKAENFISIIIKESKENSLPWFRAKLHSADIASKRGNHSKSAAILRDILKKSRGIPDEDIIAANKLLMEVQPMDPKYLPPVSPEEEKKTPRKR